MSGSRMLWAQMAVTDVWWAVYYVDTSTTSPLPPVRQGRGRADDVEAGEGE